MQEEFKKLMVGLNCPGVQSHVEVESKFFGIVTQEIVERLEALGATKKFAGLVKTTKFDCPAGTIKRKQCSVKLRTYCHADQEVKVLIIKGPKKGRNPHLKIRDEIEIYFKTEKEITEILKTLELHKTGYQEKQRISYALQLGKHAITFDIDQYPEMPPYLEIEGHTVQAVKAGAQLLGLALNQGRKITNKEYLINFLEPQKVNNLRFK